MIRTVFVTTLAVALAACGRTAPESDDPVLAAESPASAEAGQTAANAPPPAFVQCRTCHQVQPGKHGVGPSLSGVHGRKAGTAPGYFYSSAIKSAALTWDDASLDRYIEAPIQTVPGTKMVYPGLKDAAKRAEVVAYLKTL